MIPFVEIGEIVSRISSWNPANESPESEITYIDIASVNRETKQVEGVSNVLGKDAPSRARQVVKVGDVLVSTVRPNLNAVAFVPEKLDGATASTGYCVLRPVPNKCDGRYLFHWVMTQTFIEDMVKQATGASYPAVSDRIVKNSKMPLPPLPEQRRIAAILDKAAAIRHKRQEAIRLTEEFLRSVFLDMFGDPVTNPKGWREQRLDEISEIQSGITKGRKANGLEMFSVPYMRVANVQDGHIDLGEIKEIDATSIEIERYLLQEGDILLTEGGDPDKLGRGAVWRGEIAPCIHQNHIFRVRPDTAYLLPEFASTLIGSARGKNYFLKAAKQTTGIASINKTQLSGFPALVPPMELQEGFVGIVRKQATLLQHFGNITTLQGDCFSSLVQRAFRGDL